MASTVPYDAFEAQGENRSRLRWIAVAGCLGAATLGISLAALTYGSGVAIAILCAVSVLVLVWARPWIGVIFLVAAAALIEQFSLVSEGTFSDGTDRIPFFQSLNTGAGLGGVYATPFELFLVFVLVAWVIKGFASRTLSLPRSPVSLSMGAFAALVAIGWFRGVTAGGSFQDSLLELRPWLYLSIAFVASSQLLKSEKHVKVLIAVLATGIGIKGVQGVVTLITHPARPQAILAHEESFFFGLYLALLAGLWLMPVRGRLRTLMTAFFPFVLASDIANQRRTGWAVAAAVLVAIFVLTYLRLPERRGTIVVLGVVGCILGGIYWVGFSNDPGLLGQPARAVLSQLAPSVRDQQSNQYRTVENVNLGIAIRQTMPLGSGFGHPIPQAVPNVDIRNIDSFISYLPHNGLLYVWLRLGIFGIFAFWLMIGVAIMTAVNTFRRKSSPTTMVLSLTVVCALIGYVVQGGYDMGLYWFRIAIVVGCLLGALEAVRRVEKSEVAAGDPAPPPHKAARGVAARLGHAA